MISYENTKWAGAISWIVTYILFTINAIVNEIVLIPLIICAYNISYEILFTILAKTKGQRFRNGLWMLFDTFFIYTHLSNDTSDILYFVTMFILFVGIQLAIYRNCSIELTKSFAWFVTLIMSIYIITICTIIVIPFQLLLIFAIISKLFGDGFYGIAHMIYGLPGQSSWTLYYTLSIRFVIVITFIINVLIMMLI